MPKLSTLNINLLLGILIIGAIIYVAPLVITILQIVFFDTMVNFLSTFEVAHGGI